jgi:hypothetical protein
MDRGAIKDLTYGGLMELLKNRTYFYNSAVGAGYSHWTEEGKQALAEFFNMVGHEMLRAEERELDARAKKMVLDELKK